MNEEDQRPLRVPDLPGSQGAAVLQGVGGGPGSLPGWEALLQGRGTEGEAAGEDPAGTGEGEPGAAAQRAVAGRTR